MSKQDHAAGPAGKQLADLEAPVEELQDAADAALGGGAGADAPGTGSSSGPGTAGGAGATYSSPTSPGGAGGGGVLAPLPRRMN
jgi:hypothetical protein